MEYYWQSESESNHPYIEVPEVDEPKSAAADVQRETEEGGGAEGGVLGAVRLQELVDHHEGLGDPLDDLVELRVVQPGLHLLGQEFPPEMSAQEAPDWLDVVGEENPPEVAFQLEVCRGPG